MKKLLLVFTVSYFTVFAGVSEASLGKFGLRDVFGLTGTKVKPCYVRLHRSIGPKRFVNTKGVGHDKGGYPHATDDLVSMKYGKVKRYHEQTKHHPHRYARSPGFLDWVNQPVPFRLFKGALQIRLPLINKDRGLPYSVLYGSIEGPPDPISIESIAKMLELSVGLSAWKKHGSSEWALRMNPSSGNLHPTECYLVLPDLPHQQACVTHYNPYLHVLEERALLERNQALGLKNCGGFGIILTSVPWREAWKYGERAFRYCQHDLGHAMGALRYACNLNGWKMRVIPQISEATLDRFLGFDKFEGMDGEPELADCLCWVEGQIDDPEKILKWFVSQKDLQYEHHPNRLSPEHVNWEIIDTVREASQTTGDHSFLKNSNHSNPVQETRSSLFTAEDIIRKRRSAQSYNQQTSRTDLATFIHTLRNTLPGNGCPFDVLPYEAQVHLAIFVHAVEGLEPGLYMLVRNPEHFESLKNHTHSSFDWSQVKEDLPLYLLQTGNFRDMAQSVSCNQAIAGDSAYALGMIAHFDSVLKKDASMYPRLFWETGLVGQVLYLEAEAHDLRGTGIGCFFDNEMHRTLGIKGSKWQSLYHFTVGNPVDDTRLETKAPYFHLNLNDESKVTLKTLDAMTFDNRFTRELPADPKVENYRRQVTGSCFSRVLPDKVSQPSLVAYAEEVAAELNLSKDICESQDFIEVFSGNSLLADMDPYATCYGGHQFGNWAGQLGDGRAINLGEVVNESGERRILQLKGAGITPYSRMADGRAVLHSSVREFLCSEAMYHLGVPTTRALSLMLTGEKVVRDMFYDGHPKHEPGAVVCRVAPSFTRFGSFQIFTSRGEIDVLQKLVDYTIRTDFPHLGEPSTDVYLEWFAEVCQRTLTMIMHWERVGFVHGVMNTDNMSVLGLTIDYGPYGWLEGYDPNWTPNTTDASGRRYRFGNQSQVALWNLGQFAQALLPLISDVKPFEKILAIYSEAYKSSWKSMMAQKLGLNQFEPAPDNELITELITVLQLTETDMTIFFRNLALLDVDLSSLKVKSDKELIAPLMDAYYIPEDMNTENRVRIGNWIRLYIKRLIKDGANHQERCSRMNAVNPKYVLRNYLAQLAIDQAEQGDHTMVNDLLDILRNPYDEQPGKEEFAQKRPEWARHKPGCSMLSCSS